MKKEKTRGNRTVFLALLWILLAAVTLIAVTFAWFSFNTATNVEPVSSTISEGDASLLISNSQNGDFDVTCKLTPESNPDVLSPVSTANLNQFFTATAQSPKGISILYKDVTSSLGEQTIHGTVYLKSTKGSCDVYLYQSALNFGTDRQALAALRLGLKITTKSGTASYIFRLDDMADTGSAKSTRTVPQADTVVSSISAKGSPSYEKDPAASISEYAAKENGSDDDKPEAGNKALAALSADEVASVEYWLYLEGCDDNCINDVQNKDLSLQLGFAGVKKEAQ